MHASVATWIDEAVEWFGLAERRTLEIGVGDPSNWGEEHANPFTGFYVPTDKNPRP